MPSPHIICAKFRAEVPTPLFPESQPVTSPMAEQWNDPWSGATIPRETDGFLWVKRESKEDIKQQRRSMVEYNQQSKVNTTPKEDLSEGRTPDGKGESLRYDINIGDGTQGTWLVLDTLDELGTDSRSLAGSCLTFLFFPSALESSTCPASMFTRHDQHYLGSRFPPSGLLLFSILPIFPPSFSNWCLRPPIFLPLSRVAYGGFPTGTAIRLGKRE